MFALKRFFSQEDSAYKIKRLTLTLNKAREDLTPSLQQRVTNDYLQETLQSLTTVLDHIITEAISEDLARQRGDGDAGRLALEDVAEVLEVGVAPTDGAVSELEGGDVGAADDLVVGVHAAAHAVRAWILDLEEGEERLGGVLFVCTCVG